MTDTRTHTPTTGTRIANDIYWLQLHEPVGRYRLDRLAELIDEAIVRERASHDKLVEALRWSLDKLMDARACGYGGVEADEISERLSALSETKEAEGRNG